MQKVAEKEGGTVQRLVNHLLHVTNALRRKIVPKPVTGHVERIKILDPALVDSGDRIPLPGETHKRKTIP